MTISITPPVSVERRSLSQGLSYLAFMLLVIMLGVTCYMIFVMDPKVQSVNRVREMSTNAESRLWRIGFIANRVALVPDELTRRQLVNELGHEIDALSDSLNMLAGDIPDDLEEVRTSVHRSIKNWNDIKKDLLTIRQTQTPAQVNAILESSESDSRIRMVMGALTDASDVLSRRTEATSETANMISTSVYVLVMLMVLWILIISRNVSHRINNVHDVAQHITKGDLSARADVQGNDELTGLATSFNAMASQIESQLASERQARKRSEEVLAALRQTAENLALSASDILAATTEQAAAMSEEAAAVQETSVTVEELKQVTTLSAQKAGTVASLALQSEEVTMVGREAVDRSVEGMLKVREEVQSLAQSMQRLSEQTQAVGEIISTVQDLAEQSNMLAVNAAIEAARAGEHGYGFSVVANEVRSLAEQSRQATVQVRSILGEIQKAVTTALENTQTGSRSVEEGVNRVNKAGDVIRKLSDTIGHSSQAASQIRASSDQHAAGVDQIAQAIAAIRDASVQALENTHQTERQAKNLKDMSFNLKTLLHGNDSEDNKF